MSVAEPNSWQRKRLMIDGSMVGFHTRKEGWLGTSATTQAQVAV